MDNDAVLQFVSNMMMADDELEMLQYIIDDSTDSSDDEEEKEDEEENNNPVVDPKISNYLEEIISKHNLDDFKSHFRMSRAAFQELLIVCKPKMKKFGFVPAEKKLLLTIWILAHSDTFKAVGERFEVSHSTAYYVYVEIIQIFNHFAAEFIQFSNDAERIKTAYNFEQQCKIPGIVGAIAESRIPIKQPPGNSQDKSHSIILQGICDENMRFIDIFVGMPGQLNDANVFKQSPIYGKLNDSNNSLLLPDHHLMGNNAYPNSPFMITPYPNNGSLTNAQVKFNTNLSSVRRVIERAFSLLKDKFQRLKLFDVSNIKDEIEGDEIEEFEVESEADITDNTAFANVIETNKRLLFTANFE